MGRFSALAALGGLTLLSGAAGGGAIEPGPDERPLRAAEPPRRPLAPQSLAAEPRDGAKKVEKKRRYVVAAMGDSLTDPRSHGGKYLEHLRERCPHSRFDSYGVGGHMVNQMRKRFAREVLGIPPDEDKPKPKYTHVIVLGGINDICSDESAKRTNDKIRGDLSAMYRMAHQHGIDVIALTLPPWGGFKRYYNERRAASTHTINRFIRDQALTVEVSSVLDIYPVLSCGDPELLCDAYGWPDKVHWSAKGHEVVGKALHAHDFADCE